MQKKSAMKFIVIMGIVSLFSDMTYEAARSITGPYMARFCNLIQNYKKTKSMI